MRDELVKETDVTATVDPTYKKAITDFDKRRKILDKTMKGKEVRKKPILGNKDDNVNLEESLFEDIVNESGELTKSPYKDKIGEYFDHTLDFDFLDVVADVLESAIDNYDEQDDESKDVSEAVFDAEDRVLIYYNQQWTVLEHYLTPQEANWAEAIELFENDLIGLASEIIDEREEETDESLKKGCKKKISKKINESKKLKESYGGDVIEDLIDRAESNYDGDLEEAVRVAIDDGLTYTKDVLTLLDYFGEGEGVIRLFFDYYYDDLFNEIMLGMKERGYDDKDDDTDESLKKGCKKGKKINEEKSLPFISDEFSEREREIVKPIVDKFSSKEDQMKELKRQKDSGEITDIEYKYVRNYWDTLVDFLNADDGEDGHETGLYNSVYNDLFSYTSTKTRVKGGGRNMQRYDSNAESDVYFDPKDVRPDRFPQIDFDKYEAIGIKSDNLKRAEAVAKEYGLDTIYGKSGKTIILLVPKEYADVSYNRYKKAKNRA